MSAATVLNDVAAGIVSTLTAAISGLKGYANDPTDIDALPAVTVWGPSEVTTHEPDIGDSQVGSADWHANYSVRLFSVFDDPVKGTQDARSLLGQAIAAIAATPALGLPGTVLDSSLVRSTFALPSREERPMSVWDCELHVWILI